MGMLNRTVIIGINGWPAVYMHCAVLREAAEKTGLKKEGAGWDTVELVGEKEAFFTGREGEIEQDAVLPHRPPAEAIFLPGEVLSLACRSGPYITGAVTHQADAARSEATVPSDAALIYLLNLLKGCAEIACSSSRFHGERCKAAEVTEQRTVTRLSRRTEEQPRLTGEQQRSPSSCNS